jgi:hypothetical protein
LENFYTSKSVITNLFGEPQVMHQNQPFFFWGGNWHPKKLKEECSFTKFLNFLPTSDYNPKKEFVRCKSGFSA